MNLIAEKNVGNNNYISWCILSHICPIKWVGNSQYIYYTFFLKRWYVTEVDELLIKSMDCDRLCRSESKSMGGLQKVLKNSITHLSF